MSILIEWSKKKNSMKVEKITLMLPTVILLNDKLSWDLVTNFSSQHHAFRGRLLMLKHVLLSGRVVVVFHHHTKIHKKECKNQKLCAIPTTRQSSSICKLNSMCWAQIYATSSFFYRYLRLLGGRRTKKSNANNAFSVRIWSVRFGMSQKGADRVPPALKGLCALCLILHSQCLKHNILIHCSLCVLLLPCKDPFTLGGYCHHMIDWLLEV